MSHTLLNYLVAVPLLLPGASLAGAITVNNVTDHEDFFLTVVRDSTGVSSATHRLVDVPDTPWANSSVITESSGLIGQGDSVSVSWTSHHLDVGPHNPHLSDIVPNSFGPATFSLSFTATAAGVFTERNFPNFDPFDPLQALIEVVHSRRDGVDHFDQFLLAFREVTVTAATFGGFDIQSYEISYRADHCETPLGDIRGCHPFVPDPNPPPPPPDPEPLIFVSFGVDCEPFAAACTSNVPAPGTLALLFAGFASFVIAEWKRRRERSRLKSSALTQNAM